MPGSGRSIEQQLLRGERAARRHPDEGESRDREGEHGQRQRSPDAGEIGNPIVTACLIDEAGRHEHRRFRGGVRNGLKHAAGQRAAALKSRRVRVEREREHQKEVGDLRDGGVCHQQLEPLLSQGDHVADDDRGGAEPGEKLRRPCRDDLRQHVEPQPHHQEPRTGDHQTRQHGARRRRSSGVRRRQPQVQREERGLGQQPDCHQRRRRDRGGTGLDALSKQLDVERAVDPVQQDRPE